MTSSITAPRGHLAGASLLLSLLSLLLALAGCASLSPSAGEPAATTQAAAPADDDEAEAAPAHGTARRVDTEPAPPAIELSREILFQVLAAEVAVQRGQVGVAAATYLSLAKNTGDARLARRATELALAERSLEHAMQAAQLWYQLAPQSQNAIQTVEALWLATGRLGQVEPLLAERLARARADGSIGPAYQQLGRTLMRASDKTAALALFDRLSQSDDKVPDARLAAASIAAAADQPDRAAAEATEALALRPDDERSAVSAAQYVQKTRLGNAGAAQVLERFLERQPRAVEARFTYARLLAADGKAEVARDQMALALKQEPESPAILFGMAQLAHQLKQPEVAVSYLNRYVALPRGVQRDNVPAYLFLAQIAEERKRYDEAIGWLEKVNRGEQFLPALTKRALLMGRQGKVDQARELLQTTSVTSLRERTQLTSAEAQVLRDAQRYAEAFDVLDKALERAPGNVELLYDHAMAAERINNLKVMETSLRKVIEQRPDYAHAYNALGYSLADHNLRLDEAEKLIEKALQLAPEDPHIIDSMGWVYFRQGRLELAIQWLRKAFDRRAEPEIAAHLGEALWKAGRAAEARDMWREAQRSDPNNETLKETLARLNVAL
jgi:tetratricopeptide (TPR) repeat protein